MAMNRRRDPDSGETKQLIGTDLDLALKTDTDREKTVQSWRAPARAGLKSQGQRTRYHRRHGRTVGSESPLSRLRPLLRTRKRRRSR